MEEIAHYSESLKGTDDMEDLGVDMMIILKWT
jgi:hypothetical protein